MKTSLYFTQIIVSPATFLGFWGNVTITMIDPYYAKRWADPCIWPFDWVFVGKGRADTGVCSCTWGWESATGTARRRLC